MGTRIYVSIEHHFGNYHDRAATTEMLAPTIPAAQAIDDYWRSVVPDFADDSQPAWTATPPSMSEGYLRYDGPGSLSVRFGRRLAVIHTGARWRGFLNTEPLRRVHLAAFRNIARHLGSKRLVFFPDGGVADDLGPAIIYEGITQEECMATLQRAYGPAQPSIDDVAPEVVAETEHHVPSVWYMETLKMPSNDQRIGKD